jgi:non-specific serine/threonine protein kinase
VGQQSPTAELVVGSEFAGYRIEEVAARGGMGVVYRASQLQLTRTVALKLVTPSLARDTSFRERFRREWMIAASMDHPNVIPVYEAGEEDGVLYLAMRWVEGTDLRETIDNGPLEPARAAHIVAQVASALDAAHERGLIHRDVKPANILLTDQDHVYLTDFGLTKHASTISGLTRTGQWVGTVDYTAPEQIEGTSVDRQTDVYSLGCVLFETLTGRAPYKRENDLATLWAHVYAPPPSVRELAPHVSEQLEAIVQRAMSKDPGKRFGSAGELGEAALAAVRDEEAAAPAPSAVSAAPAPRAEPVPSERGPRPAWRPGRRALVALAGALAAVAAIVAIVSLSGSDEPASEQTATTSAPQDSPPVQVASPWRRLPAMPTARQYLGSAVVDGTIWALGGLGGGSVGSRQVEGLDPVVNGWTTGPDLPDRLHHLMVVAYKGEVVALGGWIPRGPDPSAGTSGRVYALRAGKWVRLPSLNQPRAAAAAAVVGDQIVVMGGQANGRLVRTTEVFDGERWTRGADIPTPREHLAAASDGQFVYAVGGRALSSDKNSAALERYDPARDRWERLRNMPTARGGLAAAVAEGQLFAVGGEQPTSVLGTVEAYRFSTNSWAKGPSMRTPRHGSTLAAVGSALYSIGGSTHPGHASATAAAELLRLAR